MDIIHTHHEHIPNFAADPECMTIRDGVWSDPSCWHDGRVPSGQDRALVMHAIEVDDGVVDSIGIMGKLTIRDFGTLAAANILVHQGGGLYAGADGAPAEAVIVVRDKPLDHQGDPLQFGTGIICLGEIKMYGHERTPFLRLTQPARAGETVLVLEDDPVGWRPGDELLLPDSRQRVQEYRRQNTALDLWVETARIARVDGAFVTLVDPLMHDHLGSLFFDGTRFRLPHVANLTRSICIMSESATGTRGHVMVTGRAYADVRGVRFQSLGRTTISALHSAVVRDGVTTLQGLNQPGRYPWHAHHCAGPENVTNTGYQGRFEGNVLVDTRKWAAVLHDTHWNLVRGNIAWRVDGAAFVTEQGNEYGNEFLDNMAVQVGTPTTNFPVVQYGGVGGPGRPFGFGDFGFEGSGFWLTGNTHVFRNNVASNCAYAGLNLNARNAGGFANHHPVLPKYRGVTQDDPAGWEDYKRPYRVGPPVLDFDGNEVYSCSFGLWVGFSREVGEIKNTCVWHIQHQGMYSARNDSVTYDGLTMVNDARISALAANRLQAVDIESSTYLSGQLTFRNLVVEGYSVGIHLPGTRGRIAGVATDVFEVDGGRLTNWVNVVEASAQDPKQTIFRNVQFGLTPYAQTSQWILSPLLRMPKTPKHFVGYINNGNLNANAVVGSTLVSINHDLSGADVEYFLPEQAPGYVMPTRRVVANGVPVPDYLTNCPESGLTNAECWAKYGVATLGRVATCTEAREDVDGFLCAISGTVPPPTVPPVVQPPVPPVEPPTPPVEPPTPPVDDLEFAIGGRVYRVVDDRPADSGDDGRIRVNGITYEVRRVE